MDFAVTFAPEMEAFREEVKSWLSVNAPKVTHSSDPRDYTQENEDNRDAFRRALGQKGWLYPVDAPKWGGGGLTVEHAVVLYQELEKVHLSGLAGLGSRTAVYGMLALGSDEQKNYWVPKFMKGEADSWQLLTEPHGGSDLASAKTTAILDGDDYVVNGSKIFVGEDFIPEFGTAIVMSDPTGARHQNLSYLVVPLKSPGITIQPLHLLNGIYPSGHKNMVFFDDVRIPAFNRIGGHNQGWQVASINMEMEHGGSGNIGEDQNLTRVVDTLKQLQWDGKALIEDPDTREMLGELLVERETQRLFGLRNYWMHQSRQRMEHEGPQLSYWNKNKAHSNVQSVHDLIGFYSLTRDPKYVVADGWLESFQRTVFPQIHAGGGLNIQATIMARRLGLGRNSKDEAARFE